MSSIANRAKALQEAQLQKERERQERSRAQRQANFVGLTSEGKEAAQEAAKVGALAMGKQRPTTSKSKASTNETGKLNNATRRALFQVTGNMNARLAKYCDMLKRGVPRLGVEQKMRMEGIQNVSILDKCAAKTAPVNAPVVNTTTWDRMPMKYICSSS